MTHPVTTILPHPELASVLSKSDVVALSELSDFSQVRAWTRRKVASYKKSIPALPAIHNSIARINKLPTEILQKVFAYVPSESSWCNASWMVFLQSVCRRWRSVLLATPEYWLQGLHIVLDPRMRVTGKHEHEHDCDEEGDDDEDNGCCSSPRDLFLARSAPCPLELLWRYTSGDNGIGWDVFEEHFDRVTTLEVDVQDEYSLYGVLDAMTTSMKRLERLELNVVRQSNVSPEDLTFDQWEAEDLPRLGQLRITLFCRATTVPSWHTVTLFDSRDIWSLPGLLDALEGCPALASLSLHFDTMYPEDSMNEAQTLDRIVNLPNLRSLDVGGQIPDLYCFFSRLSFPSTTHIQVWVSGYIGDQFALLNILPRRISGLHTPPTIDRLYIHSEPEYSSRRPGVSMIGFVQGAERLQVSPAFELFRGGDSLLQFLEIFDACTVTELALYIDPLPNDMIDVDGVFWRRFFAALPDVRRLQLLSRTLQSRATKRDVAKHFLAAARALQQAGHETSLAWVVCVEPRGSRYRWYLMEELGDVEEVLRGHARQGGRLNRLELYVHVPTWSSDDDGWSRFKTMDVTRVTTDRMASRFVAANCVSQLEDSADVVIVGGGWGCAEDDEYEDGSEDEV